MLETLTVGNSGNNGQAPTTRYLNGVPYCWNPFIDTGPQSSPILILLYALLMEKRVLFVGYQRPCGEIANYVLAAAAMASGGDVIPGIAHRVFPYASLAAVDSLQSSVGFIAGVTNPVFEEQPFWWDVCINFVTLKLTISPQLLVTTEANNNNMNLDIIKEDNIDDSFVKAVTDLCRNHVDENDIREHVYRYTKKFLENAMPHTMPFQKQHPRWTNRINGWKSTVAYQTLTQVILVLTENTNFLCRSLFPKFNVQNCLQQLQFGELIPSGEIVKIFTRLDAQVQKASDEQILEILASVKSSDGACVPFSYGLFHHRFEVRTTAARMINRLYMQKVIE